MRLPAAKPRLTVIGNPVTNTSSGKFLVKFCYVLGTLTDSLYIVNDGPEEFRPDGATVVASTRSILKIETRSFLGPIKRFLAAQVCSSIGLLKCIRRTDVVILFPVLMVAPAILAKLWGKPLVLYEAQDVMSERPHESPGRAAALRYQLILLLRNIVLVLVDAIVVEGASVIRNNRLERLQYKTFTWHQGVDTGKYQMKKPLFLRGQVVGFLASLETRKGILEFAKAIRLVYNQNNALRFLIGGEGALRPAVEALLADMISKGSVRVLGLVHESVLCDFYNDLSLYVLPSESEGLPNSILESMACGTPVLATAVGALPDVIEEGKTGFLISNNAPELIAAAVLRAINSPNLALVSELSRRLMETEFSFDKSAEAGARVLAVVCKSRSPFRNTRATERTARLQ